jgi:hypothetical protein
MAGITIKYATIAECRNYTGVAITDVADAAMQEYIDSCTAIIDFKCGRTWQGQYAISNELYDGDGTTTLYLKRRDIRSVTALSIDDDYDGTYTTVTATYVAVYPETGRVELNTNVYSPQVSAFTQGFQTVKISYTYGLETKDSGTASAVGAGTLTDAAKTWTVNQWTDYTLQDSAENTYLVLSNTATILTVSSTSTPITGAYKILEKIPEEVRDLCKMIVANKLKLETAREEQINAMLMNLTSHTVSVF